MAKKEEIENIQIDYAIIFANYGETDAFKLGLVRGGGSFKADGKIANIEFDESRGSEMGMQYIEEITAVLSVTVIDTSMKVLKLALPWATYDEVTDSITCTSDNIGIVPETSYLKNVVMFAKTLKKEYRKITLYNPMSESGFEFKAIAKKQGEINLEFNAHFDPTIEGTQNLFKVETVASLVEEV